MALIGVSLGFVVWQVWDGWPQLTAQPLSLSAPLLLASLAVLLLNFLLVAAVWAVVFRDRGETASVRDTFAIIYAAQLGRYIPGKVWLFLGQIYLAEQKGFRKTTALTAAIVQNISGGIGAVLVIAVSLLGAGYDPWLFWGSLALGVAGLGAMLVAPRWIEDRVNAWRKRRGKEALSLAVSRGAIVQTVLLMALAWVVHCVAFVLLVASLRPVGVNEAFQLAFAYNFAYHVAFYMLIIPGGIGVREGTLTLIIEDSLGAGWAGIISILQRLWFIGAELAAFGLAMLLLGKRVRRSLFARARASQTD